jgi:hypothetical protein
LPILLLSASCATVQVSELNRPTKAMTPRPAEDVELFLTKAPPTDYREVYLLRSEGANTDEALRLMREKAGELGCDGLVIAGKADRVVGTPNTATGGTTVSTREGYVASCIVFE